MSYTKEEYISRINNASPIQLVVITFELCIANLKDAKETKNKEEQEILIKKSQDFLMQLMTSLDMSHDISHNLLNIYLYINKILHESYFNGNIKNINESIKLLSNLLKSFDDLQKDELRIDKNISYQNLEYNNGVVKELIKENSSKEYKI